MKYTFAGKNDCQVCPVILSTRALLSLKLIIREGLKKKTYKLGFSAEVRGGEGSEGVPGA